MSTKKRLENELLWKQRIAEYRASGVAAKKIWSQQEGYKFHTLRYWIQKLNLQQTKTSGKGFVELVSTTVVSETLNNEAIRLSYDSYHIDIPKDYHEDTLIRLLGTLKKNVRSLPCCRRSYCCRVH